MISNEFLQPMGIGELLDKTIKLYKKDFAKYLSLSVIGYLPLILTTLFGGVLIGLNSSSFEGRVNANQLPFPPSYFGIFFLLIIISVLFQTVLRMSLIKACQDSIFDRPISIGECLKLGLSKFFPYLIAGILIWLSVTVGFILLIIPGIIFLVWFSLFEPVIVIEDIGYASALGRSRSLVKGYFWRTLGFFIVTGLLVFIIVGIISQVLGLIPVVGQIIGFIIQLAVFPFQLIAETLYYYNQRVIKEGYDLALTANEAGLSEGETAGV